MPGMWVWVESKLWPLNCERLKIKTRAREGLRTAKDKQQFHGFSATLEAACPQLAGGKKRPKWMWDGNPLLSLTDFCPCRNQTSQ